MKNKYPDWLVELSKQMNDQPSRSTSNPFWQVRFKKLIPTEQGYGDVCFELCGEDGALWNSRRQDEDELCEIIKDSYGDFFQEFTDYFEDCGFESREEYFNDEFCPESNELPEGAYIIYLQEVDEVVWTGLTKDAAEQFIARKQHDYPPLYTYVESAYWSPQFCQLMDWVKSLSISE